ncbi:MAG TPA: Sec-independent protein translocase protein TatB [Steroidobacteraceae bacterium]|nr:Sec-independent protein translocase protein TatB [Steroidobacteraceae bacterium]
MLDFGFSEILLTSAIALVVLGPERLPKVARQVGNWMGRARVMARQLTEQLDREISAEEILRLQQKPAARSVPIGAASPPPVPAAPAMPATPTTQATPAVAAAAATPDPSATPAASGAAANAFSDALRDTAEPAAVFPTPLAPTAAHAAGPSETSLPTPAPATEPKPTATGNKPPNE